MPKALMVVGSNPTSADTEQDFNDWYTNTHLDDVISVPGYNRATRYRLHPVRPLPGVGESRFRYLAIYEVEVDDLATAAADLESALENGQVPLIDALDRDMSVDFYELIEDAQRP
ncbi:hypothetical protein [Gordonia sp. NPDC127522]|uniref:hypothetical protein n=1 Tax=Gordonia sp. NPDC127522 TaxID=3345390 RepID=UPI00362D1EB9